MHRSDPYETFKHKEDGCMKVVLKPFACPGGPRRAADRIRLDRRIVTMVSGHRFRAARRD